MEIARGSAIALRPALTLKSFVVTSTRQASVNARALYLLDQLFPAEVFERNATLEALLLALHRGATARASDPVVAGSDFAICLYLTLFARYPRLNEIAQARFLLETSGAAGLIRKHLTSLPFADFLSVSPKYRLKMADPARLLVDVTHTSTYPFNSGIQRVVRSLVGELLAQQRPISLFYMSDKDSRPALLDDADHDKLMNWEKYSHAATKTLADDSVRTNLLGRSARALLRQLLKFPVDFFVHSAQWSVEHLFGFSNRGRSLAKQIEERLEPWSLRWSRWVDRRPEDVLPGEHAVVCDVLVFREPVQFLIPELPIGHYVEFYLTAKRHFNVTYSIVVYDLIPLFNPDLCAAALKTAFLDYLRMYRVVDRMTCISQDVAGQIRRFLGCLNRASEGVVETHYLGCNLDRAGTAAPPATVALPAGELPLVLCVGTFEPRKNGITLLRAAILAQSRGVKFKLVFAGNPGWLMEGFLEECEEALRQGYQVECLGHVSEDKLKALYKACYFSVFPSLQEGFGLPIVESLDFGKPCIVSDAGSMSEIAAKGGCLKLKDPRSFEELSQALEKLLGDPALYARLRQEAIDFQWPSWSDYARDVFEFSV
jgi:glycosyltransferase involved in cell wall biosynthesis